MLMVLIQVERLKISNFLDGKFDPDHQLKFSIQLSSSLEKKTPTRLDLREISSARGVHMASAGIL